MKKAQKSRLIVIIILIVTFILGWFLLHKKDNSPQQQTGLGEQQRQQITSNENDNRQGKIKKLLAEMAELERKINEEEHRLVANDEKIRQLKEEKRKKALEAVILSDEP